ncbi:MAG: acylphosphatase [Elusimicrobiota bacterium]
MQSRIHIIIDGEVQGVGYRYFAVRLAQSLGIVGWVLNKPDGSVEIDAEGEKTDLDRFIARLKTEHKWAIVKSVETNWFDPTGNYSNFFVKYY